MKKYNVAYIEGRPHGHPIHTMYAKSLDADFYYVDFRLRYHDIPETSALRRYLSWIICAFTFPDRRKYDVFLSEEAYFMLGFMKKMRLMSKKQKLVAIMSSHTLYFLYTNQYSESTKKAFIHLFKLYDAFICVGPIQVKLLNSFLDKDTNKVKVYQTFNGVSKERLDLYLPLNPNLQSLNILTIGDIPNQNRIHYKGIDLMLMAFENVKSYFPNLTFTIVGDYNSDEIKNLLEACCPKYKSDVIFKGKTKDLDNSFKDACLYLHTARGEAWGISVTEAMAAGVTPIVSDWTGAKDAVAKISEELIVPLNVGDIVTKLKWYLSLPIQTKMDLSDRSKKIAREYSEEKAVENFKTIFNRLYVELVP